MLSGHRHTTNVASQVLRGFNWPVQGSNSLNVAQLSQPRGSTLTFQHNAGVSYGTGLRHGVTMHPRGRHLREGRILLVHGGATTQQDNERAAPKRQKHKEQCGHEAGNGEQNGSSKERMGNGDAKKAGENGYEPKQYHSIPDARCQSEELYRRCQARGRQMQKLTGFPEDTEQHGVADEKESPPSDKRKTRRSTEAGDGCHPAGPSRPRVGRLE